jgi:hypothetical protein
VASLGLALFAVVYRSTLERGQRDEAAYTVPASYVLSEDLLQLIPVLHGSPPAGMQVLRLSGNVPSAATFSFLGLPAQKLGTVGGWRADFASRSLSDLGASIAPARDTSLRTVSLPAGRHFTLPVTAHAGDDVIVRAFFRSSLGDYIAVSLGHTDGGRPVTLRGRIPFRHATLDRLELDIMNSGRITANAGVGIQPSAKGTIGFGPPRVDGRPVTRPFAKWTGTGGVGGTRARLGYVLTPDRTGVFRPTEPTDGRLLPVLATPHVAAEAGPHGVIPLQIEGEQVAARVVGIVRRFPSIVGDAVIADRVTASTALDTRYPGLGSTNEVWVNGRTAPHVPALTVQSRADTLARLRADPLARGALLTLAGTSAVALLLALVGLVLAVVGDVRDDRGELFDLEAQGAAPKTIRAHLRLRALLVAAFGIVGGLALGAILSALVISLVSVTASAAEPEPPLRLSLDAPLLAAAAAAYVMLAALLVVGATTLRGRAPARAAESAV